MIVSHTRTKRLRKSITTDFYCLACDALDKNKKNKNEFNCVKVSIDRYKNIKIVFHICHVKALNKDRANKYGLKKEQLANILNNLKNSQFILKDTKIHLVEIQDTQDEDELEDESDN